MLLGLGANWVLGGLDHFSQFDRGPEPSLRCFLRQQHHLRPKYQYRYHWFKSRMKRKKKRKFRKPPSLFYLTWKYKFLLLTIWTIKILLTVGCRVGPFVRRAFGVLLRISSSLCTDIPSQAIKALHYLHLRSQFEFVVYASEVDCVSATPMKARFDTDSFKIGIDTQCLVTMSSMKHERLFRKPLSSRQ